MLAQAQVQDQLHLASQGELACGQCTVQHLSMKQVYLSAYTRKTTTVSLLMTNLHNSGVKRQYSECSSIYKIVIASLSCCFDMRTHKITSQIPQ